MSRTIHISGNTVTFVGPKGSQKYSNVSPVRMSAVRTAARDSVVAAYHALTR